MVEPVGREYNRRLSADDARDNLCEAARHEFSSSMAGASRLDDWILNGSGVVSAPGYPAELFSNASAAAPPDRGSPSVQRVVVSNAEIDNLIRSLAAARHAVSAEEFHRFVSNNDSVLSKLLPAEIQAWVARGAEGIRPFDGAFTGGSVLQRGAGDTIEGRGARVVLSANGRGDYIILTGYPLP
jgi:hypothetical protein